MNTLIDSARAMAQDGREILRPAHRPEFPAQPAYRWDRKTFPAYATPQHRNGAVTFVRDVFAKNRFLNVGIALEVTRMIVETELTRQVNADELQLLSWAVIEEYPAYAQALARGAIDPETYGVDSMTFDDTRERLHVPGRMFR